MKPQKENKTNKKQAKPENYPKKIIFSLQSKLN